MRLSVREEEMPNIGCTPSSRQAEGYGEGWGGGGKKGGILRMNGGWANESLAGKRDGSLS